MSMPCGHSRIAASRSRYRRPEAARRLSFTSRSVSTGSIPPCSRIGAIVVNQPTVRDRSMPATKLLPAVPFEIDQQFVLTAAGGAAPAIDGHRQRCQQNIRSLGTHHCRNRSKCCLGDCSVHRDRAPRASGYDGIAPRRRGSTARPERSRSASDRVRRIDEHCMRVRPPYGRRYAAKFRRHPVRRALRLRLPPRPSRDPRAGFPRKPRPRPGGARLSRVGPDSQRRNRTRPPRPSAPADGSNRLVAVSECSVTSLRNSESSSPRASTRSSRFAARTLPGSSIRADHIPRSCRIKVWRSPSW